MALSISNPPVPNNSLMLGFRFGASITTTVHEGVSAIVVCTFAKILARNAHHRDTRILSQAAANSLAPIDKDN